jgi:hypothetical protein
MPRSKPLDNVTKLLQATDALEVAAASGVSVPGAHALEEQAADRGELWRRWCARPKRLLRRRTLNPVLCRGRGMKSFATA